METISIDRMTREQLPEVAEVFLKSFNAEGEVWTPETATKHVEQNFFGDAHWVALEDGKVVGFLMAITLVREHGEELFIDSIAVLPQYGHHGVGTLLWQQAEAYLKHKDLVAMRLLANPAWKSFAWYQEMGFAKSGWVELHRKQD